MYTKKHTLTLMLKVIPLTCVAHAQNNIY